MRRLSVFNNVSLDGYFTSATSSVDWAYQADDLEWNAFIRDNAKASGSIVLGRITYEMMVAWWPTAAAKAADPAVAEGMNGSEKIVFSRTLRRTTWSNTRFVADDPASAMRGLKNAAGGDMVILGSGTIVAQLADADLIDTYQLVVNPVVLGAGRSMFEGVNGPLRLRLAETRTFRNGKVVMTYAREHD
ncbi:MAG: dihydrofolate reductase [Bauldia sp.]|nr:dihydrofolate reductase [Bauldia sp.]